MFYKKKMWWSVSNFYLLIVCQMVTLRDEGFSFSNGDSGSYSNKNNLKKLKSNDKTSQEKKNVECKHRSLQRMEIATWMWIKV